MTEPTITQADIEHMVNRFLQWKLPENFRPDNGITFDRVANLGTEYQYFREPIGTNLFDATQAEAMVRHMVEGLRREASTADLRAALKKAVSHLDHMAAWVSRVNNAQPVMRFRYNFEALGEDMPAIRAVLNTGGQRHD